jgi:hypothetical protein
MENTRNLKRLNCPASSPASDVNWTSALAAWKSSDLPFFQDTNLKFGLFNRCQLLLLVAVLLVFR